jgi:hypothetical protein
MSNNLDGLLIGWMQAKQAEKDAIEARRAIEDELVGIFALPDDLEGTIKVDNPNYKISIVGRFNRKIDSERLQEIAVENGLEAHLSSLFRWKPEINAKLWKAADDSITRPLLKAITTEKGRPSFTIEEKE